MYYPTIIYNNCRGILFVKKALLILLNLSNDYLSQFFSDLKQYVRFDHLVFGSALIDIELRDNQFTSRAKKKEIEVTKSFDRFYT